MRHILSALAASAFLAFAAAGAALADWAMLDPAKGFGRGAVGCAQGEMHFTCLLIRCDDGPAEIALVGTGGDFGKGEPMPTFIRLGSGALFTLTLTPKVMQGTLEAETAYDPARHGGLITALKNGRHAMVSVWQDRTLDLDPINRISLRGSARAIDTALALCPKPASAPAELPSMSSTGRFIRIFKETRGGEDAERQARRLVANALATIGPEAEMAATMLDLSRGRHLLAVKLGPSVELYGIAAHGTELFMFKGEEVIGHLSFSGTIIWADLDNIRDGWPDLWMQSVRGMERPFGVWRWEAGEYKHHRNVAP